MHDAIALVVAGLACAALLAVLGVQLGRGKWVRALSGNTFLTAEELAQPWRIEQAKRTGIEVCLPGCGMCLALALGGSGLLLRSTAVIVAAWAVGAPCCIAMVVGCIRAIPKHDHIDEQHVSPNQAMVPRAVIFAVLGFELVITLVITVLAIALD